MPEILTEGPVAERIARIGDQFAVSGDFLYGEELRNGHINTTYRACYRTEDGHEDRYILQRINEYVFKDPAQVMRNVEKVTRHITWKLLRRRRDAAGQTLNLFPARGGRNYIVLPEEGGMWRCYNNIEGTHTYDVVENTRQAYQAGFAFGSFQDLICDMNPEDIRESIPDFHNTPKRYADLLKSAEADVMGRAANCRAELELLAGWANRYSRITDMLATGEIPTRITHNDTKINNVMLDEETDDAVCVIDLDTVMPGSVLYDFGDMVRTATCMAREDEEDLSLVRMEMPFFESLAEGYLDAAHNFLTQREVEFMPFSGWLITTEIGIRFLTDYLDGDKYFRTEKPEHNLIRARNQLKLAQSIDSQLISMGKYVRRLMKSYSN
ncbi:MAG: aminoglycoside phosphotransferase family protein [Akkermansia sp.]|nr:aminoglycoside phosphotransferase family protein [Akkermansia sp.]MBR2313231.1 aminoglycoside phosphotransferase family protein [Akkermansia sp.]